MARWGRPLAYGPADLPPIRRDHPILHWHIVAALPDVLVTVDGIEHQGNLRAWAVDDETGDWWGQCQYTLAPGQQLLGWIHQDQLRRDGNLNDNDGLPSKVIALHDRDA